MVRKPIRLFISLLALFVLLVILCLPENYRLSFRIGSVTIDRVINPPVISLPVGTTVWYKDFRTRLGLDLAGGTHVTLQADMRDIPAADRSNALESAKEVIERRVNFFGIAEPTVQTAQTQDAYRIIVELPGVTDVDQAVQTIGQTARLEFREFTDMEAATQAASPAAFLAVTSPVGITGKDLKRAQLAYSTQTGEPEVAIEFTSEGAKKFSEVTKKLIGKPLAIFLDDLIISAPIVNNEIIDGNAVISGQFTRESARFLSLQLNAGALPVPVAVVEKRTVGATLGAESVQRSIQAGIIGLVLVAIFMILRYRWLGLFATLALILYGLLNFALYRLIPITLTLPGIAGFILSIGMAVDSNILIFERYQEELRKGKPWHIAMEQAFGRAWDSIRDANFTTLITCLILFNPGNWQILPSSGLVRGFAVTLFIGVVTSLFTGLVVTRTLIRVLYRPKGVTS